MYLCQTYGVEAKVSMHPVQIYTVKKPYFCVRTHAHPYLHVCLLIFSCLIVKLEILSPQEFITKKRNEKNIKNEERSKHNILINKLHIH